LQVPAYQPETAYKVFQRALFNLDIATGKVSTASNSQYATKGRKDIFDIKNEPVKDAGAQCYVLDREQCTSEQWAKVMNGTALIKNWIVVDANTSSLFPDVTGNGTGLGNGSKPSGNSMPSSSTTTSGSASQYTGAASSVTVGGRVVGVEVGVLGVAFLAAVVGCLIML
jgi:hypothetical protein